MWVCVCPARLKLGHWQAPAALIWPLCGYRCFTLRLVKLSKREKLLPQFVREGGGGTGGGGVLESCCIWIQYWHTWLCCVCWTLQHSNPVPGKAILFLSWTQVSFSEGWFSGVLVCVCVHACACVCACVCHMPAGTLLGWWCVCHTYWEEGYRATGSLGVHSGERKQA